MKCTFKEEAPTEVDGITVKVINQQLPMLNMIEDNMTTEEHIQEIAVPVRYVNQFYTGPRIVNTTA